MKRPYADEVPFRRVAPLLLLMAAVIALVMAAAAALNHLWDVQEAHDVSGQALQGIPPALETAPQPALQAFLAEKDASLEVTAWLDPGAHLARIPIEAAMRALAADTGEPAQVQARRLMGVATPDAGRQPGPRAAARALQESRRAPDSATGAAR